MGRLVKNKVDTTIRSSAAEYLIYVTSVGAQQNSIEMCYEDENIWLTQKMMATLYDVDVRRSCGDRIGVKIKLRNIKFLL